MPRRVAELITPALLLLAGCGLLLDPDPVATTASPRDGSVGDAALRDADVVDACPDGGCSLCSGVEVNLSLSASDESVPTIAGFDGGFIVAWDGPDGTVLRAIDADGSARWNQLIEDPARSPIVAATDGRFAIVTDSSDVTGFAVYDFAGARVGGSSLSSAMIDVSDCYVTVGADGWAAVWEEDLGAAQMSLVFDTVGPMGNSAATPTPLTGGLWDPDEPKVARVGDQYVVAWDEDARTTEPVGRWLTFTLPSITTSATGGAGIRSDDITVASNETDFILSYVEHDSDNSVVAQRFTDAPDGTVHSLTSGDLYRDEPDLAWSGSEWAVVFEEGTAASTDEVIQLITFTADGSSVLSERQMSHGSAYSIEAAVAWGAGGWGVVWEDTRDGNVEIYYAYACP